MITFENLKELETLLAKIGIDTTEALTAENIIEHAETKVHLEGETWHALNCAVSPSSVSQPTPSLKEMASENSKLCFCVNWRIEQLPLRGLMAEKNYPEGERIGELVANSIEQANRYPSKIGEKLIETAKTRFLLSKVQYHLKSTWVEPLTAHLKELESLNSVNLADEEDKISPWCLEVIVEEMKSAYYRLGVINDTLVEKLSKTILQTITEEFSSERKFITVLYPHHNDLLWDVYHQGDRISLVPAAVIAYLLNTEYLKEDEYCEVEEEPTKELIEIMDQLQKDNTDRSIRYLYQTAKALT